MAVQRLLEKQLSGEMIVAGYKPVTYLVCPRSGVVIDENKTSPE
jgi:hypothetical protein